MIKIKKILLISLSCVLFGSAVGCKEAKDSDVGHVNEHTTHRYRMEVVEPTSNEEGYTIYTCICGDSYIGEYININEEVFLQAVEKGGICAVDKNIKLDSTVYITKNLVVDLVANISIPNDMVGDGAFCVKSGTLTLNGNGVVNGKSADNCDYNMAIWADGGDVVINGGTYTNEGAKSYEDNGITRNNNEVIYVKNGSTVTINGGTFIGENPAYTLNSHDSQVGTIVIRGGEFYKFNPATDANDATIYVAEGYKVVAEEREDGTWYIVIPEEESQPNIMNVDTDLVLDSSICLTEDLVVNLNANISMPNDMVGDGAFCVKSGTLTLNGNGTVNAVGDNDYCLALWADGGKIVINGGIYTNEGAGEHDHYDLLYVKNGGIIEINGGEFKCQTPEWTLNSHDSAKGSIVISGGKFYKFNPAELPANLANDNITVAEGYTVIQDGDWYMVVKA